MAFATLLALAVALALDAFAVAVASGVQLRAVSAGQTLRMAGTFGFFQFAMPVIGWFLGAEVEKYIQAYDHWVAFSLLAIVGGRMLWEAWSKRGQEAEECRAGGELLQPEPSCDASSLPEPAQVELVRADPTRGISLLVLGVATSIDALAVGLSFGILGQGVWIPSLVIGLVCFVFTAAGLHLGKAVCALSGSWTNLANSVGGLALIAIGLNILHGHAAF